MEPSRRMPGHLHHVCGASPSHPFCPAAVRVIPRSDRTVRRSPPPPLGKGEVRRLTEASDIENPFNSHIRSHDKSRGLPRSQANLAVNVASIRYWPQAKWPVLAPSRSKLPLRYAEGERSNRNQKIFVDPAPPEQSSVAATWLVSPYRLDFPLIVLVGLRRVHAGDVAPRQAN